MTRSTIHTRYHTGKKTSQCNLCLKEFSQSTHLLTHERQLHSEKERERFICSICNKGFITKPGLMDHTVSHSDKEPYPCEFCPKSFKLKRHLKYHCDYHHSAFKIEFKCKTCSKVFTQSGSVYKHIREVHEDKRLFNCEICNYSSNRIASIRIHTDAIHNNVKFICPICSKEVAYKSHMTRHKKEISETEKTL